jgi:hypothetical protein
LAPADDGHAFAVTVLELDPGPVSPAGAVGEIAAFAMTPSRPIERPGVACSRPSLTVKVRGTRATCPGSRSARSSHLGSR